MMESYVDDSGRSVIKSIETDWKGSALGSAGMGFSGGVVGCVLIFICWHCAHPLM